MNLLVPVKFVAGGKNRTLFTRFFVRFFIAKYGLSALFSNKFSLIFRQKSPPKKKAKKSIKREQSARITERNMCKEGVRHMITLSEAIRQDQNLILTKLITDEFKKAVQFVAKVYEDHEAGRGVFSSNPNRNNNIVVKTFSEASTTMDSCMKSYDAFTTMDSCVQINDVSTTMDSSMGSKDVSIQTPKRITLAERLDKNRSQATKPHVKETIARAYDLHRAAKEMHEIFESVKHPIVKKSVERCIQEYDEEKQEIISTPKENLRTWELSLLDLVKYRIEHDEGDDITKTERNPKLNSWLQSQRAVLAAVLDNNRQNLKPKQLEREKLHLKIIQDILKIKIVLYRVPKLEEYMQDLREFKKKHGHCNVRQIGPNGEHVPLGNFVCRMRKEYDALQKKHLNKVCSLTPELIEELNSLGFVWRIRSDRPRKGDPNFRLRRKAEKYLKPSQKQIQKQRKEAQKELAASSAATAGAKTTGLDEDDSYHKTNTETLQTKTSSTS